MALPAKRIPKSVAHLDVEIVAAALIRHDANVRNAARALGVPSGDLRKLVLVDQRLADTALEAVELKLDDCEANLSEALHCGDPRRRDSVSMFMLRNAHRAAKRGYAVAASAASVEANVGHAPPQTIVVRWAGDAREMDVIERDGQKISIPRYGDGRGDECLEGEVAWIPERSATRLREADLNVLSKLGNQGLEWRLEPEAFTGGEVGREDDLLDVLVGCPVDIQVARQPST